MCREAPSPRVQNRENIVNRKRENVRHRPEKILDCSSDLRSVHSQHRRVPYPSHKARHEFDSDGAGWAPMAK